MIPKKYMADLTMQVMGNMGRAREQIPTGFPPQPIILAQNTGALSGSDKAKALEIQKDTGVEIDPYLSNQPELKKAEFKQPESKKTYDPSKDKEFQEKQLREAEQKRKDREGPYAGIPLELIPPKDRMNEIMRRKELKR